MALTALAVALFAASCATPIEIPLADGGASRGDSAAPGPSPDAATLADAGGGVPDRLDPHSGYRDGDVGPEGGPTPVMDAGADALVDDGGDGGDDAAGDGILLDALAEDDAADGALLDAADGDDGGGGDDDDDDGGQ